MESEISSEHQERYLELRRYVNIEEYKGEKFGTDIFINPLRVRNYSFIGNDKRFTLRYERTVTRHDWTLRRHRENPPYKDDSIRLENGIFLFSLHLPEPSSVTVSWLSDMALTPLPTLTSIR